MVKKEIELIRRTVSILDSVDYKRYSDGKANNYLEYASGTWGDEIRLISPVLFYKFVEQVLNFKLGETIGTQERTSESRDIPDYVPIDTRTHPFVFDCKGMDTCDLSMHYSQIRRYLEGQNLKYGILVNMRDIDVYTLESSEEIEAFNFSFVELYRDYKESPATLLDKENTKRFLNFVERFSRKRLTAEEKIERIAKAKPWSKEEQLNVKLLTQQLKHIVNILYNDVSQRKSELTNKAQVGRVSGEAIAYEIEEISSHISGAEFKGVTSETFDIIMNADEGTSYGKAREAFFRRVAYFAMTRLLIARAWEDIGFIPQSLFDGGFEKMYNNLNRAIGDVLAHAFRLAGRHYPWLFNGSNNYSWYEPSDEALIDSLYELSNFYLGKLDQDILGTIYEDYIDRVDKKNKGQYYTPREVVSFIWDRVGYNNAEAYFWHIEGKRVPKLVFDPATGSGGFLVEAARRIRECPQLDWSDPQDLRDIWRAILWRIFGAEISPFPYYLTQVNLLVQLTPVIRRLLELTGEKPREEPTPLGVLCRDSMGLHNPLQLPMQGCEEDNGTKETQPKILHFTVAEEKIYEKIQTKHAQKFSYVCANPPYVGEKGHKELFQTTRKLYPYWENYYQGKMDYLHWFIILGLSKLREWGKLGFITSAYWPTADGASKLRKYILDNAKIKEMIFFEDVKIFEHAKGQHNMVFVLTKCSGKDKEQKRENNHIKIVRAKCKNQDLEGQSIRENLAFLTNHIQKHLDNARYEDEYIKVFWSGVKQGELPKDGGAWNEILVEQSSKDLLQKLAERGEPLQELCDIIRGVDSSADKVTQQNILALPTRKIEQFGIKRGDGIFLLTENERNNLRLLPDELEIVKPTYKNSDICPYFVDIDEKLFVIYAGESTQIDLYPNIRNHLEKFREILENRGGHTRGEPGWYSLHRLRNEKLLRSKKIVCSRWGEKGPDCFGLQTGECYEGTDTTVIVPRDSTQENVFYILALLNSCLIKKWITEMAQRRGYTAQSTLFQIPIRRIDFDNPEDSKLHDEIVEKVKIIREKMAQLAANSKYFNGTRLTRLKFEDPLPEINLEAVAYSLPPEKWFCLRIHPEINVAYSPNLQENKFVLSRVSDVGHTLEGAELRLHSKDRQTLSLHGPEDLLNLLAQLLQAHQGEPWTSIKEEPFVPRSFEDFGAQKQNILKSVSGVRQEIRTLQESIDSMVCELYGVSEDALIDGVEETSGVLSAENCPQWDTCQKVAESMAKTRQQGHKEYGGDKSP